MSTVKDKLFRNWHVMRVIRLLMGAMVLAHAITTADWVLGSIAALFLYQGIMNKGCCGTYCNTVYDKSHRKQDADNVSFEEVKS